MLKVAFFSAQAYDNAIFSSLRLEQIEREKDKKMK